MNLEILENQNLSEIIEDAGRRNFEDSKEILSSELMIIQGEKTKGVFSQVNNVGEIDCEQFKKIFDGPISYQRIGKNAKIVLTSDIHGGSDGIDSSLKEFVIRKNVGEEVYYCFTGDIGTGEPQKVDINEKFASLKNRFPLEVSILSGNGDRRSLSLINGFICEAVEKFFPELHIFLKEKTDKIVEQFAKERKDEDKDFSLSFASNCIYGAQFLRLAKESGASPLEYDDLEVLYETMRTASGMAKQKDVSMVFTSYVLRNLVNSLHPIEKSMSRKNKLTEDTILQQQALQMFDYWKTQNEIYNQQPLYSIFDNGEIVVICAHSGVVKEVDGLKDLIGNIKFETKATWNQFLKDEVTKFGDYDIYNEKDLGKFVGKLVPPGRKVVYATGHNHGNFAKPFEVLDASDQKTNQEAVRVEVCTGTIKNKDAKFAIVDLSKDSQGLNNVVEYKNAK